MKNKYEIHGDLGIIHADWQGKDWVTLVDAEDIERLKQYPGTITIRQGNKTLYAIMSSSKSFGNSTIGLHRFVLGLSDDDPLEVDHKNGNGLYNIKSNLRATNHSQNQQNRRGPSRNNKSGFLNVRWYKRSQKWKVELNVNRKIIHGGYFTDIEEAKKKATEMRVKYFPFSKESELQQKIAS